ncbi:zinc finger protein 318 isoform X1 [Rhizophagus clarus]|uniref:Zinc finger protein 318 isoform X1 n=1 Tax=Rhizophagus clarus TaxID=94130 RepID=A0A8H3QRQ2_9GLOM|nr:zinc finger protein 318 isoform X1 [Rhizophagus clarus]
MRGSSKERRRMRGRSKKRSRTRRRSKERSKTRGCSKERSRTSKRSKERRRMRGCSKKRRRTRGRNKERSKMRGRSKERSKTQRRSKDRNRTRGRNKERSRTEDPFRLVLSPKLRWNSSSSVKSSNKPVMIISSDDRSGEEELQLKKNSKKKSKISKNFDDKDDEEELQLKKNSKKKSKISRNSNDRNNDKELQPKKNDTSRRVTYHHHLVDLPKDIKENLCITRSKMEYQMNASEQPTQYQYNFQIAKGFGNKNDHSCLFKVLDTKAYLISENVLYEMIHQHHRHQREDLLNKNKAEHERTKKTRRNDPVISKLKKSELNPIVMENVYHSPEESEVDPDSDSNETCIIIQDIEWRSDYIRENERESMLSIVTRAVENYKDNVNDPVNTRHHSSRKKSRSTEEAEDAE